MPTMQIRTRPPSRAEIQALDRSRQLALVPDLAEDDDDIADDLTEEQQRRRDLRQRLDASRAECAALRRSIERARRDLPRWQAVGEAMGWHTLGEAERAVAKMGGAS